MLEENFLRLKISFFLFSLGGFKGRNQIFLSSGETKTLYFPFRLSLRLTQGPQEKRHVTGTVTICLAKCVVPFFISTLHCGGLPSPNPQLGVLLVLIQNPDSSSSQCCFFVTGSIMRGSLHAGAGLTYILNSTWVLRGGEEEGYSRQRD